MNGMVKPVTDLLDANHFGERQRFVRVFARMLHGRPTLRAGQQCTRHRNIIRTPLVQDKGGRNRDIERVSRYLVIQEPPFIVRLGDTGQNSGRVVGVNIGWFSDARPTIRTTLALFRPGLLPETRPRGGRASIKSDRSVNNGNRQDEISTTMSGWCRATTLHPEPEKP